MNDAETMLLADAIGQAIENRRKVIKMRRTIILLTLSNIITFIMLVILCG